MFIRKTLHHQICEELRLQIIALEWHLARFESLHDGGGGPYKRILECREIAKSVTSWPHDERRIVLHRLAYIDKWLNQLIPLMTERMPRREKHMWEHALTALPPPNSYTAILRIIFIRKTDEPVWIYTHFTITDIDIPRILRVAGASELKSIVGIGCLSTTILHLEVTWVYKTPRSTKVSN